MKYNVFFNINIISAANLFELSDWRLIELQYAISILFLYYSRIISSFFQSITCSSFKFIILHS